MKKFLQENYVGGNTFGVVINYSDITVKEEEIELLLGYPPYHTPDPFKELIREAIEESKRIIEIKAGYKIADVASKQEDLTGLTIAEKYFDLQKIVTGVLKKSDSIAVFSLTIGDALEAKSKELLKKGDLVAGYIYDAVASITAEACADTLHEHIKAKMLRKNQKVTNRYSPGYCNWNVIEQHILFSLLPKNFCGITLTDSALMSPIKSISGIIGIGENVKYLEYSCNECNIKDCTYRTINYLKKKTN
ncbi:MAG: Vitamin B12 dependent methionine synthase activation domain protein [Ignavibacteria bacterium]|nr:MAG: Vitamin B12 dependent methionine synthase activation domain protein [Ignavibacteria bacterium]KAF0160866.1 MAG: Vitamin B12 dependent methionine synthase activation domain protein [Ignavibacteria bacterium]